MDSQLGIRVETTNHLRGWTQMRVPSPFIGAGRPDGRWSCSMRGRARGWMAGGLGRIGDGDAVKLTVEDVGVIDTPDPTTVVMRWRKLRLLPVLALDTFVNDGEPRRSYRLRTPKLADLFRVSRARS